METDIRRRIEELEGLTVGQLRKRYSEAFGEQSRSSNRRHLVKRIAWRIQALAEGGLSERALRRAEELVDELGLRLTAPKSPEGEPSPSQAEIGPAPGQRNRSLPAPGTILVRKYQGRTLQVTVLEEGFLHEGREYRSLSAVACAITGARWSGPLFFGLSNRKGSA